MKDRITVLVAASMMGEKKTPFIIGKSANPRCFKNIKSFPTDYTSQNKAWMVSDIYARFLKSWDSRLRAENRKILLLHDNAPSHKVEGKVNLTHIELAFLPANTTAILQPCDQGIIALTKRAYKNKMNNAVLEQIDALTDATAENIARKISLLQAMQFWREAWDSVTKEAIQNCWKKAQLKEWQGVQSEFQDDESEITFNLPYDRDTIEQWIALDSELETSAPVNEDEIIREVREKFQKDDQPEDDEDDDDENDSFEVAPPPVTCNKAKAASELLNQFLLESDTHENELNLHFQYQNMIQTKIIQRQRQGTLDRFLK